jgi:hypothetical protein
MTAAVIKRLLATPLKPARGTAAWPLWLLCAMTVVHGVTSPAVASKDVGPYALGWQPGGWV